MSEPPEKHLGTVSDADREAMRKQGQAHAAANRGLRPPGARRLPGCDNPVRSRLEATARRP